MHTGFDTTVVFAKHNAKGHDSGCKKACIARQDMPFGDAKEHKTQVIGYQHFKQTELFGYGIDAKSSVNGRNIRIIQITYQRHDEIVT